MLKEVFVITYLILLSSTVESQKPIKKVLSIVRTIRNQMVTFDEITEIKNQFVDEVKVIKNQIVDEVVGEINPTIASSCSCCEPKPHHCDGNQGIFIAGGVNGSLYDGTASPPGFYNPLTNVYCDIHGYEYGYQPRYSSTTTGFIVCGGNDVIDYEPEIEARYNCQKFDHSTGTWNLWKSWENEFPGRRLHVAWKSSIGLFLIGGSDSMDTSMLIHNDGSITDGAINSGRYYACAVADPKTDTVIIIGGINEAGSTNEVIRYDIYGYAYPPLPPLTSTYIYFGCSGYYNDNDNLVLVVTGGSAGYTEHLEVGVDTEWIPNQDCYNPWDISCADANNDVYCLQGYYGYEIQEYDPSTGCFNYKSSTYYSRGFYGNFASSVCMDSGIEDWCIYSKSGEKSEPQDHSKPFPGHSDDDKNFPSNN